MQHRALQLVIAILPAVLVGAAWTWCAGLGHRSIAMHFGDHRCIVLELRHSGLHVAHAKYEPVGIFPKGFQQSPGWELSDAKIAGAPAYSDAEFAFLGLNIGNYGRDEKYGGPTQFVTIHYWVPAVVALVWMIVWLRRARKVPEGFCPQCGYDLRATPDRCPECGHEIARPASVS